MSTKYRAGSVGAAYRCNSRQASLLKHLLLKIQHQAVKFSKLYFYQSLEICSFSYKKKRVNTSSLAGLHPVASGWSHSF